MPHLINRSLQRLHSPCSEYLQDGPLAITRWMALVYLERPDLQAQYNLADFQGRIEFLGWWVFRGYQDHLHVPFLKDAYLEALNKPAPGIEQDGPIQFTALIHLAYLLRADLQQAYDLKTKEGRTGFLGWWVIYGFRNELHVPLFESQQVQELNESAVGVEQDLPIRLTKLMHLIYLLRPDLRALYDLKTRNGRLEFAQWWVHYTRDEPYKIFDTETEQAISTSAEKYTRLIPTEAYFPTTQKKKPTTAPDLISSIDTSSV